MLAALSNYRERERGGGEKERKRVRRGGDEERSFYSVNVSFIKATLTKC